MNKLILFGTYEISNINDFDNLIKNLNKEQSIYFLTESARYAFKQGIFNMEETEIISKSIRQIYLPTTDITNEKRDE